MTHNFDAQLLIIVSIKVILCKYLLEQQQTIRNIDELCYEMYHFNFETLTNPK